MSVPAYSAPPPSRPIGVAILAILTTLVGVLVLLIGLLFLALPVFMAGAGIPLPAGLAVGIVGATMVIIGLLWIAVGLGLWRLRSWAWWLAVIVMVLSIFSGAASLAYSIVPILILIYLILVRRHFR